MSFSPAFLSFASFSIHESQGEGEKSIFIILSRSPVHANGKNSPFLQFRIVHIEWEEGKERSGVAEYN
jgi:hypothetical protein